MRPRSVVVLDVDAQHVVEMTSASHLQKIETFGPNHLDPALRHGATRTTGSFAFLWALLHSERGGSALRADCRRFAQEPEPLSPRNRTRVREVSTSYRSHGVNH